MSIFRVDSRLRGYGRGELVFDPQGTGGLNLRLGTTPFTACRDVSACTVPESTSGKPYRGFRAVKIESPPALEAKGAPGQHKGQRVKAKTQC
jgi:hypothetical protein